VWPRESPLMSNFTRHGRSAGCKSFSKGMGEKERERGVAEKRVETFPRRLRHDVECQRNNYWDLANDATLKVFDTVR
jgi:hypothetical protein